MKFEKLVEQIIEQNTPYTPPEVRPPQPGETVVQAAERMSKNMFSGAYNDWQARQSGAPYEVSNILFLIPTVNGKPLSPKEISQFKATATDGNLKTVQGSEAFGLPYHLWVSGTFMSNKPANVMIESPRYKSVQPVQMRDDSESRGRKIDYVPVVAK